jgi:hypothetical protein
MPQKISLNFALEKDSKIEKKLLNFLRSLSPEEIRYFRENYLDQKYPYLEYPSRGTFSQKQIDQIALNLGIISRSGYSREILSQKLMSLNLVMSLESYRRWEEGKSKRHRIYIDAYINLGPLIERYYKDKTGKDVYQEVNEEMGLV